MLCVVVRKGQQTSRHRTFYNNKIQFSDLTTNHIAESTSHRTTNRRLKFARMRKFIVTHAPLTEYFHNKRGTRKPGGLTMSMIFFSYRRDDSEKVAGRLFKGLKKSLPGVDVFRDLGGIEVVEKNGSEQNNACQSVNRRCSRSQSRDKKNQLRRDLWARQL